MELLNFFREDLSEIVGVYFDEDKVFLVRLTGEIETAEIDFELDLTRNASTLEQLAEKISGFCKKRGWKTSRLGLCLREGAATTFHTEFKNIPAEEIESAIKIWAVAHVGKEVRYASMTFDEEIWMEALPAAVVEEYVAAFEKFSLKLCALTEFPILLAEDSSPVDRATFAAEIFRNKKYPNILAGKIGTWNFMKISLATAVIFLLVVAGFSAKLAHDYFSAVAQLEAARARYAAKADLFALKEIYDADVAEMKRLNNLAASQNVDCKKFNALLKIGKIADQKIILRKIKTSGESLELEGSAENPDAIRDYLSRLKSSSFTNVKLENAVAGDERFSFTIKFNF